MGVIVDDYSTETGRRVRVSSTDTGTTAHLTGSEWDQLVAGMSSGLYLQYATEPKVPFAYWPEGNEVPLMGEG